MGGGSIVVDPWGTVLAEAGTEEEILVADLDLDLLARTRSSFPILADRRL
jgi:predicted amidohydrolase